MLITKSMIISERAPRQHLAYANYSWIPVHFFTRTWTTHRTTFAQTPSVLKLLKHFKALTLMGVLQSTLQMTELVAMELGFKVQGLGVTVNSTINSPYGWEWSPQNSLKVSGSNLWKSKERYVQLLQLWPNSRTDWPGMIGTNGDNIPASGL